jgi:Icc-related predicted phosphoesterase
MRIKIGFISDTHTLHNKWSDNLIQNKWGKELRQAWGELDLLIFGGDCTSMGKEHEVNDFMYWLNNQPAKEKIMIAGNHDYFFDYKLLQERPIHNTDIHPEQLVKDMLSRHQGIHYLDDSGVELYGLKIWGSPIQPWFHDWAFNRLRNTPNMDDYYEPNAKVNSYIKPHWDIIPEDTDILVTHGPPYGHGDSLAMQFRRDGEDRVGCVDLMNRIKEVKPKISVFGHIHEGYGITEDEHTKYINASCLNENYKPVNPPIIIEL